MDHSYDAMMDCGYFVGTKDGLLHIPPQSSDDTKQQPLLIPWEDLINDIDDGKNGENDN